MKTYLLASVVIVIAFLSGYFFAIHLHMKPEPVVAAPPVAAVAEQAITLNPFASANQNGENSGEDKEQPKELAKLQRLLSEKEQQLEANSQALSALDTVANRYQIMTDAIENRGYFRGPRIRENFQANETFFKFFQLSPEQTQAVEEISQNALQNIQDWEVLNAYLQSKSGKKISYEIPAATEEIQTIKAQFIDDLVAVLGEDNRKLTTSFLGDLFEQFNYRRIITIESVKARNPANSPVRYKLRIRMYDSNDQRRRGSRNSSEQIPRRFSHLFDEFSFAK
ncbi:hypothetical protein SG34_033265 [Thalassomonas viridans]|uniref:Uncharacterized protein n=1 Tax=Thalassomonas viridans TaxID=137584 RepID=A0AAE9Z8M3_9GAMM|nr:hypothetical protein [Thalassomonas viridans]WDE08771.1 hypothetical protein SG34_033265 [Thalassomonas viridans]